MTRIYVAGSSAELERCERFIAAAREIGCEVTFDWRANIRRVGAANEGVTDDEAARCAQASDLGIYTADVFVLLLAERGSFGAAEEFGFARAIPRVRPIKFLIVGHHASVFLRGLPTVPTDEDALAMLRAMEVTRG